MDADDLHELATLLGILKAYGVTEYSQHGLTLSIQPEYTEFGDEDEDGEVVGEARSAASADLADLGEDDDSYEDVLFAHEKPAKPRSS